MRKANQLSDETPGQQSPDQPADQPAEPPAAQPAGQPGTPVGEPMLVAAAVPPAASGRRVSVNFMFATDMDPGTVLSRLVSAMAHTTSTEQLPHPMVSADAHLINFDEPPEPSVLGVVAPVSPDGWQTPGAYVAAMFVDRDGDAHDEARRRRGVVVELAGIADYRADYRGPAAPPAAAASS
jgi:hypothetical protein